MSHSNNSSWFDNRLLDWAGDDDGEDDNEHEIPNWGHIAPQQPQQPQQPAAAAVVMKEETNLEQDEQEQEALQRSWGQHYGGAATTAVLPDAIVSHQQPQAAAAAAAAAPLAPTDTTGVVDGIGLFKSWRHNYEDSKFACLDLLDNCFDATLLCASGQESESPFQGRVAMDYLPPNALTIVNNSFRQIKPLQQTLTAYRSTKTSADAIGEYGVGLKQALATLSRCNLVLTRNDLELEIGIVAEALQTKHRVVLPHFSFAVSSLHCDAEEFRHAISNWLWAPEHDTIRELLTAELGGDQQSVECAVQQLVQRCQAMCQQEWSDCNHVFQVVVCHLRHTSSISTTARLGGIQKQPAVTFLHEIRDMLPKHYINVPAHKYFDFTIRQQPVQFVYWQYRLVEMTKFQVHIPKTHAIVDMADSSTNWQDEGYPLSIYCGFDALRLTAPADEKLAKTCQLCIYSRASGRLIEVTPDARDLLGMASSGVDFSQGLTVIVDDVHGQLPLKPTKDGLTWTKEISTGERHKSNLYAWVGAVAYLYWKHYASYFEGVTKEYKTVLADAVKSFAPLMKQRLDKLNDDDDDDEEEDSASHHNPAAERLEHAKFTMFSDVTWQKRISKNSRKVTIRKKTTKRLATWPGEATLFQFEPAKNYLPTTTVETPNNHQRRRRGRPSLTSTTTTTTSTTRKRRSSAAAMVTPQQQQQQQSHSDYDDNDDNDDESSSGSDEEEEVDQEPPLKMAKRRASSFSEAVRNAALARRPSLNHSKGKGKVTPIAKGSGRESPGAVRQLQQELQRSQEQVRRLQTDLQHARQLLHQQSSNSATGRPRSRSPSDDETATLKQSLAALQRENEQLRQQKSHLERNLQHTTQEQSFEVSSLKDHVGKLQLALQQRDVVIRKLRRETNNPHHGYSGGGGSGGGLDSI